MIDVKLEVVEPRAEMRTPLFDLEAVSRLEEVKTVLAAYIREPGLYAHVSHMLDGVVTPWRDRALRLVEYMGRLSHDSGHAIREDSAGSFVRRVAFRKGHESVVEHAQFSAVLIGSRAMSHQLVRHRLAAITQESQRYCDYSRGRRGEALRVVVPPSIGLDLPDGTVVDVSTELGCPRVTRPGLPPERVTTARAAIYLSSLLQSYWRYTRLRAAGVPAEDARYVLPNATATKVGITMNLRQWRHVFRMRLSKHAQWEIRKCVRDVYWYFANSIGVAVDGLEDLAK